jgi:ubiquinone/menaquinone biosynthesis C-methylase UbiE
MARMQRREFIALLGGAAIVLARPAAAQQHFTVGLLNTGASTFFIDPFMGRLEELGYREGKNLVVDRKFAEGSSERLSEFAANEIGRLKREMTMSETDKVFSGSIPENYDRYLVPLIFESFAQDIARRVAELSPSAVLETAAGSGVVTRALAPRLGSNTRYHVTDLNPPMLDHAASHQPADSRISWSKADAQALPFEPASFDVVCCQFGVMFFPDRHSGFREARRVLKPGGFFVFNVWDRIEENVFADDVTNALAELFPNDPPRFLARTPHGYHDPAVISHELNNAGFSSVVIETRAEQSRASSPWHAAVAYCQGTPLRNEIEARAADKLENATDYAAAKIAKRHGSGEIAAKIQAHIVVATV